jgi:perosamine synthetase
VIRLTEVRLDERAEGLVLDVLRSGQLAQGPLVAQFEEEFAKIAGTSYAIAVANGTVSLECALRTLDIGPGDEVIIPGFTFVATLNSVIQTGATVRFADIDLETFTIDPQSVESLLTEKTRAIIPVHLYGQMADMRRLSALATSRGFDIVEDSAQAHGASFNDRKAGSWGIGSFSFYATKNIATGEGGMITTDNLEVANHVRLFRNQGMRARYEYLMPGSNHRMTELQAAVGLSQLPNLDEWNETRRRNASYLSEGLEGLTGLITPMEASDRKHVYHQYTVRITPECNVSREDLAEKLNERDIQSGIYYPRTVFDYECFLSDSRVKVSEVPNCEIAANQVLSLPTNQWLTEPDLEQIVAVIRECLD